MEPHALRRQLAREWISGSNPESPPGPTAPEPRPTAANTTPSHEISLAGLAQMVQRAADTITEGRYGERKVFVSAIWRSLRDDPRFSEIELSDFKHRLAEANGANLIALHRANLVSAMDPQEVEDSEINYLNATFHFVESERSAR